MTNTVIDFKGIDSATISTITDSRNGSRNDLLMTPQQTKTSIDHNLENTLIPAHALSRIEYLPFNINVGTPLTHIDIANISFTFDDLISKTNPSVFTKRINATFTIGNNNGGLDTGVVGNNLLYYVYVIYNPSTNLFDGLFSLSPNSPTLPSGYTKKLRIGAVTTNGSAQIATFSALCVSDGTVHTLVEGTSAGITSYIIKHGTNFDTTNRFIFGSTGNFTATGNVTAFSDESLKTDIVPILNALDLVDSLNGVEYTRISTGQREIGVIAQQIEQVLPQVVFDNDGLKSVAYGNITALLIQAIKELNKKVKDLNGEF